MKQTTLGFGDVIRLPAYQKSSETSKRAAVKIAPRAGTIRSDVLNYIRSRGELGASNDEIVAALGIQIQTVCPRMNELARAQFIRPSGRTRKTRSRRDAVCWVAKD